MTCPVTAFVFTLCTAVLTHLLQVLTIMQPAVYVIQPYPCTADHSRSLSIEVLAANACQEPPSTVLAQLGSLDGVEHDGKWRQLCKYMETVSKENLHLYMPFAQHALL
ncbi:TPA: hypothetical protein ACH3X1_001308 [Trebouxia sp. C0004]